MSTSNILATKRRAIFACCRQLGIDDEERKRIMRDKVGVESSADLTIDKATKLLDHFRQAGAKNPGKARNAGRHPGAPSTLDREPYYQKIEALLADMQLPWRYAEKTAENITGGKSGGIMRLAWVRSGKHLRAIVAALMVEKKKRLAKAWEELDAHLLARGLNRAWCQEQAQQMERLANPWTWHECLETLRLIKERME